MLSLLPLGYVLAGPAADLVGGVEVLLWGGLLGTVAMALALLSREVRDLPRLEPVAVALVPDPPLPLGTA